MLSSQGFKANPVSEGLPQLTPWSRNRTRTLNRPDKATGVSCGFRICSILVLGLLETGLILTLWLYIKYAQWGIFSTEGPDSGSVVPLELLDDGRKFGIQGRSSCFGPCGWARAADIRVLLFLVWKRRTMERGWEGRSGRTAGRSVRLPGHRRGWGTPLLIATWCRA